MQRTSDRKYKSNSPRKTRNIDISEASALERYLIKAALHLFDEMPPKLFLSSDIVIYSIYTSPAFARQHKQLGKSGHGVVAVATIVEDLELLAVKTDEARGDPDVEVGAGAGLEYPEKRRVVTAE